MKRVRNRTTLALGAALLLAGCGGAARSEPAAAPATGAMSAEELEALYRARLEADRGRFTQADVQFMQHMIHHHSQALTMAAMAPTHGAGPEIQTLAARIDNAQRDEIATMVRWLRDRGQPVPEGHESMAGMAHGAGEHQHGPAQSMPMMPGMLTPEQLARLDAARGAEFERLFLDFMIQHHRGAVVMVRDLFATDGAGQDDEVFKFAADVQADQSSEIGRMERMLQRRGTTGSGR